jgi:hypothetical protein
MKNYLRKRQYNYIITLDAQLPPRKLASFLTGESATMRTHLKQVIDMQNSQHVYGNTYRVGVPFERQIMLENLAKVQLELSNEQVK